MSWDFVLKPFPGKELSLPIQISGKIERSYDQLSIRYQLQGQLQNILIPEIEKRPSRRSRLWEETCFELFVGAKGEDIYWEFNLSPSGDWNVFGFTGYRQGMHEEPAYTALPLVISAGADAFTLSVGVDLSRIIPDGREAEIGISAVLKDKRGLCSYWAPGHPPTRPDFHDRRGFLPVL